MPGGEKPVLLFDGDCGFCRRWIERWRARTGEAVVYEASPEAGEAVRLREPDGRESAGAEAVFRVLTRARGWAWLHWLYRNAPGFSAASEALYRAVARRRVLFSRIDRALWGPSAEPPSYRLSAALYVRALALVYLVAFVSLGVQVAGLLGKDGVLPAEGFLQEVGAALGARRLWLAPTLLWLWKGDLALRALCWGGAALSVLLLLGFAPSYLLALLWAFYLSLTTVGQLFLGYQWDSLLLEAGLLAAFVYPPTLRPREPSRAFLFLTRLLLFRLMFASGAVKLLSGDWTWRELTALSYHYMTQPLPAWTAWYAHQLPRAAQKASALAMFAVELAVPFLIFAPRRPRMAAGAAIAGLMLIVAATGNYGFFNLLAVALCIPLFDDESLRRLGLKAPRPGPKPGLLARRAGAGLAAVFGLLGASAFLGGLGVRPPEPLSALLSSLEGARSFNAYGLFAVMTTRRPEIVLEGSRDGREWKAYEFPYKPGDPSRRPSFVAPHQPRLDWQMWFAALESCQANPWLLQLQARILQGQPAVLGLLGKNPFPEGPPRFMRTPLYEYRFTTPAERAATGAWWARELRGAYCPNVALR